MFSRAIRLWWLPFQKRATPKLKFGRMAYALFKKEIAVEVSCGLTLLSRLLVGPMISLTTSGILYRAFFNSQPKSTIGGINSRDYVAFQLFGFLLHAYLNSGYYCFSAKILKESSQKTLLGIWMAPTPRWLTIAALASMEAVKCLVILGLAMALSGSHVGTWNQAVVLQLICFLVFFPVCLCLGIFRASVALLSAPLVDFLDHVYLCFVLSACPYIPKPLLPRFLRALADWNPAYHMGFLMREAWLGRLDNEHHLARAAMLALGALLLSLCFVMKNRRKLLKKCFP